ncbi:hypothetical protein CEXT_493251 [Caerostris extrusa]|uniref:Uncharacterized protein n=1 Tax=Caerostris extrusa TaxID=172846 RepID=A0AAV4XNS9_CAEEX|nr:hypothetical protein CEXT_493251 [Caerostris extrusa]
MFKLSGYNFSVSFQKASKYVAIFSLGSCRQDGLSWELCYVGLSDVRKCQTVLKLGLELSFEGVGFGFAHVYIEYPQEFLMGKGIVRTFKVAAPVDLG